MSDSTDNRNVVDASSDAIGVPDVAPVRRDMERAQQATRFVLGVLLLAADRLSERVDEVEGEIDSTPPDPIPEIPDQDETALDMLRYLAIGAAMHGEKQLVQGVYAGFRASVRSAGWVVNRVDRATDNALARPFRRAAEKRMRRLEKSLDGYVRDGRVEEYRSKLLAAETLEDLSGEAVDWVAQSPEINEAARQIIAGQGAGLAGVVQDNTRQATAFGDSAVEGLVRRLLRLKPRAELSPSPIAGSPQTMYSPDTLLEADDAE